VRTSTSFSSLAFERFRDNSETLTHVFAFAPIEQLNVNVDGQAEIASGQLVSGDYYTGLAVPAALGRTFTSGDDKPAADPVAVITWRYWQQRFGGDREVIGKTVGVNNAGFTIIGVTPPDFYGALQVGEAPDVSIPMSLEPLVRPGSTSATQPWFWWVRIMGRLKPGMVREQAGAELEGLFQRSALEGWEAVVARARAQGQQVSTDPRDTPNLRVESGSQGLNEARRMYAEPLMLLMIVVGLVLLIACANVANLLLSRAAARQKEIAVRLAMGASRWRLIRQFLTESTMLSAIGGALGVLFAYWGKDVLLALRPWGSDKLILELRIDPLVLGFAITVSLLTGLLFGIAPALRSTRLDLAPALKDSSRSLIGRSRSGLSKTLIVVQVATSIVLLIGAGLFVRTLRNLKSIDVGFNRENLLLFRVDPALSGLRGPQVQDLYRRLLERIESVPGVRSATVSRHPLLSRSSRTSSLFIQGIADTDSGSEEARINVVAPNFIDTMEIPLLQGRGLSPGDVRDGQPVALINQTMARKVFGDESPLGRRFGFSPKTNSQIEIVGVVRDAKYTGLREPSKNTVYTSYLQAEASQMNFSVRTSGETGTLVNSVREAVREVEPNLPMFDVQSQVERAEEGLMQEHLFASLSSFFGLLALALACIGLYGVMSYGIARRTNEIGMRMALGARSTDVARMVMREAMSLVAIGVVIGLGAAVGTTRFIESMLFGVTATDPLTIGLGVVVMLAVAAVAGYLPARRAAQIDPMTALRYE
jgi:predicted permease